MLLLVFLPDLFGFAANRLAPSLDVSSSNLPFVIFFSAAYYAVKIFSIHQSYSYNRGLFRDVKCHYGKRKFPIRIITV